MKIKDCWHAMEEGGAPHWETVIAMHASSSWNLKAKWMPPRLLFKIQISRKKIIWSAFLWNPNQRALEQTERLWGLKRKIKRLHKKTPGKSLLNLGGSWWSEAESSRRQWAKVKIQWCFAWSAKSTLVNWKNRKGKRFAEEHNRTI